MIEPNTFLVGPPKTATTSVVRALERHPEVFVSDPKEPMYFSHRQRSEAEYLALFAEAGDRPVVAEASTHYLATPGAIERLVRRFPAARLVVGVRDPVARAISHYDFRIARGRETRSLDQVLDEDGRDAYPVRHSLYGEHVGRLLTVHPADRVVYYRVDDLRERPDATLRVLQGWLGIGSLEVRVPHANETPSVARASTAPALRWLRASGLGRRLPEQVKGPVRRLLASRSTRRSRTAARRSEATARIRELLGDDPERARGLGVPL